MKSALLLLPPFLVFTAASLSAIEPSGLTVIDHRAPEGISHQLFLAAPGGEKALLCRYTRHAEVVFAPSQSWLAVNEHMASSGGHEIRIFRRSEGARFEEVLLEPRLSQQVIAKLQGKYGFSGYPERFSVDAVEWKENEKAPLCLLEARLTLDGSNSTENLACDPRTGQLCESSANDEKTREYRGAWFSIRYPANFTATGVDPGNLDHDDPGGIRNFDGARFVSPDGRATFYVYSPQWSGESAWLRIDEEKETLAGRESRPVPYREGDRVIEPNGGVETQFVFDGKGGAYTRYVVHTRMTHPSSTDLAFGFRVATDEDRKKYAPAYQAFKASLQQFAD